MISVKTFYLWQDVHFVTPYRLLEPSLKYADTFHNMAFHNEKVNATEQ